MTLTGGSVESFSSESICDDGSRSTVSPSPTAGASTMELDVESDFFDTDMMLEREVAHMIIVDDAEGSVGEAGKGYDDSGMNAMLTDDISVPEVKVVAPNVCGEKTKDERCYLTPAPSPEKPTMSNVASDTLANGKAEDYPLNSGSPSPSVEDTNEFCTIVDRGSNDYAAFNSLEGMCVDGILEAFLEYLQPSHASPPQEDKLQDLQSRVQDFYLKLSTGIQETQPIMAAEPSVIGILETIKVAASGEDIHLKDTLASLSVNVFNLLGKLRPVDLEKLHRLMDDNKSAGDTIEGKDVLLLLGTTGAGKTTTLQFLAGATFEEVEVDGFEHLQAISFPSNCQKLEKFVTSCEATSVTRSLQTVEVTLTGEQSIVLCDTPGFSDTGGIEVDISNGWGTVRAIQRAKSVKPVLVFSEKGIGDRFHGITETLNTITKFLGDGSSKKSAMTKQQIVDLLKPFDYLFTKYEKKYQKRLFKQFIAKRAQLTPSEESNIWFVAVLDDIIEKINPDAKIVSPLEVGSQQLLNKLWGCERCMDPKGTFVQFVSEAAYDKLSVQLQYTKANFDTCLSKAQHGIAEVQLQKLLRLAVVLPEVKEFSRRCIEAVLDLVLKEREGLQESADRFAHSRLDKDLHLLRERLETVLRIETLRVLALASSRVNSNGICQSTGEEFCRNAVENLAHRVGKSIFESQFDGTPKTIAAFLKVDMSSIAQDLHDMQKIVGFLRWESTYLCVEAAYYRAASTVLTMLGCLVSEAESICLSSDDNLQYLFLLTNCYILLQDHFICLEDVDQKLIERSKALDSRWCVVLRRFKNAVTKAHGEARGSSPLSGEDLSMVELHTLGNHRRLLNTIAERQPKIFAVLKSPDIEMVINALASLDERVLKYFEQLIASSEGTFGELVSAYDAKKREAAASDHAEILDRLSNLEGSLLRAEADLDLIQTWSYDMPIQTKHLAKRLQSLQIRTQQFREFVDDQVEKLENELTGSIESAVAFLQRLKSVSGNGALPLADLKKPEAWPTWDTLRKQTCRKAERQQQKRSLGRSILSWMGWDGDERPNDMYSNPSNQELERTMDEIARWFYQRVLEAAQTLSSVDWADLAPGELIDLLFGGQSRRVLLCLEFFLVQEESKNLSESILLAAMDQSVFQQELVAAEVSLAQGFATYCELCDMSIATKCFDAISEILSKLKSTKCSWNKLHAFVDHQWSFTGRNSRLCKDRRDKLTTSIDQSPDYFSLRDSAIKSAIELDQRFDKLAFLLEPAAKTANEHCRAEFYEKIAFDLEAASKVASIAICHAFPEVSARLQSLHSRARENVLAELRAIFGQITSLISVFPEKECEFGKLYIWLGNLSSIAQAFSGIEPTVSGTAVELKDQAGLHFSSQLVEVAANALTKSIDLLPYLVKLKQASVVVVCWRSQINDCIEKILRAGAKKAPNSGRFILDLSLALKNCDDDDAGAAFAQQILSEHKCFEGAVNAVFNSATARQGIEYVLRGLELSPACMVQLKKMYNIFIQEYQEIVKYGLQTFSDCNVRRKAEFLGNLVVSVKVIVEDYSVDYEARLTHLTAHIFAYWSLAHANSCFGSNETGSELDMDITEYLMKPHAAQVIAVWLFLNYQHTDFPFLKNHLIEVKTGEGKSVVIGVAAIILAVMGFDVNCVCYSSYLCDRDEDIFTEMFEQFGVDEHIDYSSIAELCDWMLEQDGNFRNVVHDVLLGEAKSRRTAVPLREFGCDRPKILLVDEVDVFFKDDFYGNTYNRAVPVENASVKSLVHFLWNKNKNKTCKVWEETKLFEEAPVIEVFKQYPDDVHPLVRHEIRQMVRDARTVSAGHHENYHVTTDGKIGYKEHDGVTTSIQYGYETMFAYLHEYEKGAISMDEVERHLALRVRCGYLSYAELPVSFDVILGLSGTLQSLSVTEKETLKGVYSIDKFSYLPSVYGENKLKFASNSHRDLILCKTKEDYFLDIRNEIDRRRKPTNDCKDIKRAILVFFRTSEELLEFYESDYLKDLKSSCPVRVITEAIDPDEKEGAFLQATTAGSVSLLIRDYGRGTDFKCFDLKMTQAGGVHVIQTFFALEVAEEIQIKGRTARQGSEGSYSMVLNMEVLQDDLKMTEEEILSLRSEGKPYSILDNRRREQYEKRLSDNNGAVQNAEGKHYRTVAFLRAAQCGLRKDALDFLFECNGVPINDRQAFRGNEMSLKQEFLNERRKRIDKYHKEEKTRRHEAKNTDANLIPELLIEDADRTHYGVLGISRDASKEDIVKAYRQLARKCHPDNCKSENATALLLRIKEARDTLMCDQKRRRYDKTLNPTL